MSLRREFFALQVRFANGVAALSGVPLASALLDYTNLYVRFGLGREFDATHPVWREYVFGLQRSTNADDWTYEFYVTRLPDVGALPANTAIGCFSFARLPGDRIRLHFQNAEAAGHSPLGADRRERRLTELRALFAELRRAESPGVRVVGASWLYNLASYRSLFPDAYIATAAVARSLFRHMPLWGQFLDRTGAVKANLAEELLRRLAGQSSVDGLDRCFPFPVLALEAPASAFYDHYGL